MTPARARLGAPAGAILLAVVVAAFTVEATQLLATNGAAKTTAVILVVVGSVWFASTRRTPLALAVLMLYLGTLDGFLKLASGSGSVSLIRDVLLYAIVAGLLARAQVGGRRLTLPPLSGWVIAYVVFVLVQIANPSGGTLTHSLAGVKPHLEFIPLFFLGYVVVREVISLRRFVLLLLVVATADGIVGFVQSI